MSYSDIQVRLKLFLGQKQATINQDYEVIAEIISGAFGNKTRENVVEPKTAAEAVAAFKAMFNKK